MSTRWRARCGAMKPNTMSRPPPSGMKFSFIHYFCIFGTFFCVWSVHHHLMHFQSVVNMHDTHHILWRCTTFGGVFYPRIHVGKFKRCWGVRESLTSHPKVQWVTPSVWWCASASPPLLRMVIAMRRPEPCRPRRRQSR